MVMTFQYFRSFLSYVSFYLMQISFSQRQGTFMPFNTFCHKVKFFYVWFCWTAEIDVQCIFVEDYISAFVKNRKAFTYVGYFLTVIPFQAIPIP